MFTECVYVLVKFYEIPREDVADSLKTLLLHKGIINADKSELLQALSYFVDNKLDVVDCILAAKSGPSGFELFTFDRKSDKLARGNSEI